MSRERNQYRDWANNCALLADFLEKVPDQLHDQQTFIDPLGYEASEEERWSMEDEDEEPSVKEKKAALRAAKEFDVPHACGTTACAMGWAALSGEFRGLRYDYKTDLPVISGEGPVSWDKAANRFFGPQTFNAVFMNTDSDKAETIQNLRDQAQVYCDIAKETA